MKPTHELRSQPPVFPVLLPVVLLVLAWMANLPIILLSEGTFAFASCVPLPIATIGTVLVVVALARFRSGASRAPWLLWIATPGGHCSVRPRPDSSSISCPSSRWSAFLRSPPVTAGITCRSERR